MVSDESNIISGLLVGLNALDISIDLRSEVNNLDLPVTNLYHKKNYLKVKKEMKCFLIRFKVRSIDYSDYLRERIISDEEIVQENENSIKYPTKFFYFK